MVFHLIWWCLASKQFNHQQLTGVGGGGVGWGGGGVAGQRPTTTLQNKLFGTRGTIQRMAINSSLLLLRRPPDVINWGEWKERRRKCFMVISFPPTPTFIMLSFKQSGLPLTTSLTSPTRYSMVLEIWSWLTHPPIHSPQMWCLKKSSLTLKSLITVTPPPPTSQKEQPPPPPPQHTHKCGVSKRAA